ncbi:MAG: hypothetical protein ACNA8S_09755 [Deferrisomatales bacterium]
MRNFIGTAVVIIALLQANTALSYESGMHQQINELAINNMLSLSDFDFGAHIYRTLWVKLDSRIHGNSMQQWIIDGG